MRMLLYRIKERVKGLFPVFIKNWVKSLLGVRVSKARRDANRWLAQHAADITGVVLDIGSGSGSDKEGRKYRDYFPQAALYVTSEVSADFDVDLVLDVRNMPEVDDATYDCVFCSGVLEHVDDYQSGIDEITRIIKPGGILLLGLPFRQAIHLAPHDFWRFTEYGLRYLLEDNFEILHLDGIDERVPGFPASYWIKARRK